MSACWSQGENAPLIWFAQILGLISGHCEKKQARCVETRLKALTCVLHPGSLSREGRVGSAEGHSWPHTRPPVSSFRYLPAVVPPRNNNWLQITDKSQILHKQLLTAACCSLFLRVLRLPIILCHDLLATAASSRHVSTDMPVSIRQQAGALKPVRIHTVRINTQQIGYQEMIK